MRAWKCMTWGGPHQLELGNMPDPEPADGEVEITVKACGVNFADLLLISGRYQVRPELPFVPGIEVAGRVTRLGSAVESLGVGDKVAAYVKHGGYADKVVAPVAQVVAIPESIPVADAAAFPVSYGSAELALERAQLSAGEVVLVGGAAGAVGTACVELAKQRGAVVVACVGDSAKEKIALACGADHIVSSRSRILHKDIQSVVADGVDVIVDPVGGGFFEESLQVLNYGGRVIVLGFASGKVRHQSILGSSFGLTCVRNPGLISSQWARLTELLASGQIQPRISHTRPFSELPAALQMLKDRRVAGRIVLA
jgi:NADPH2:quinone reductase